MTMKHEPSLSPKSMTLTMFSCWMLAAALASRWKRSTKLASVARYGNSTLMATVLSIEILRAL